MLKINTVQSNVATGYCKTVTDEETNRVLFCSTISTYKNNEAKKKKRITSEAQAISFVRDEQARRSLAVPLRATRRP